MTEKLIHQSQQFVSALALDSMYAPDQEIEWYISAAIKKIMYLNSNPNWKTLRLTVEPSDVLEGLEIRASVEEK